MRAELDAGSLVKLYTATALHAQSSTRGFLAAASVKVPSSQASTPSLCSAQLAALTRYYGTRYSLTALRAHPPGPQLWLSSAAMVFKGNSENAKTVLCTRQGAAVSCCLRPSVLPTRRLVSNAEPCRTQVSVAGRLPLRRSLQLCTRRRRNTLTARWGQRTPCAHLRGT